MQTDGTDIEVVRNDENFTKHRCFCKLLPIRMGAISIGILHLSYFLYELFSTIYLFKQTGYQHVLSFSLSSFGIILAVIAVLLLFLGIKLLTPYLLVPHLLMQVAAIFILCVMGLFCIFSAVVGTSLDIKMITIEDTVEDLAVSKSATVFLTENILVTRGLTLILAVLCVLLLTAALIEIWMFTVVLGCYFYLQEESFAKKCKPLKKASNLLKIDKNWNDEMVIKNDSLQRKPSDTISDVRVFANPAETDC